MARIVMKFGGTSMAGIERIRHVAGLVKREAEAGHQLAVVVYTTDPRIVPRARKLPAVTFEEMLELASVGAKVLQTRSVGLAMRENMPIRVLSSFDDRPGTMVVGDEAIEEYNMERQLITGIAYDKNEARVTLTGVPDRPGSVAAIFAPLAEAKINVDMIVQSVPRA